MVEHIGGRRPDPERRRAVVQELGQLREARSLTTADVRLAASNLGVTERTVWRWLSPAAGTADAPTGPQVYVVDSGGDDLAAVRHLNTCGDAAARRAVLQPAPGPADVLTLGWELQATTGESSHAGRREDVIELSWEYGQAWLADSGVTDLIVDQAHLLTPGQVDTAATAAGRADANLWLLWGTGIDWLLWGTGIDPYTPGSAGTPHLVAGTRTQVISLWEFYQRLPTAALPPSAEPEQPGNWPPLPAADFPTFLAACRRYLPRADFAQVARLYYDTADAADAWLDTYGAPRDPRDGQLTPRFEAALTGWLRDTAIGPAACGPAALVRLRAVQAALFARAIVLSWQPGALGPQPASRLPGNLTAQVAGALQTAVRTDVAAAAALSEHLNQGPTFFDVLQLSDVAPDGSAIRVPATRPRFIRRGISPDADGVYGQMLEEDERSWRELAAAEPIRIPAHARSLFVAHLATRRASGGAGTDPYFVHPRYPGKSPKENLRAAIRSTTRRFGLDLPWMHGGNCRHGTDIGLTWRSQSWLGERGLILARGPGQDQTITPPRPMPWPRPRWISDGPP